MSRVARADFDAALVPGFREATRAAYRELNTRADADMRATLDEQGRFLATVESPRDCPLCAAPSSSARPLFTKLGMRIVECRACGLVYSANVLEAAYDHRRYVQSQAQSSFEALKRNEAYAELERVKSAYIVQRLGDYGAVGGRFLDVGPGAGRLLDAARDAGWVTTGIEVNPQFARAARERGHCIVEGFFPRDLPPGLRFEAIALLDVLEHLHDPLAAVRACTERLTPGGVVAVQVPNVESLLIRLEHQASLNFCHGHWNHFAPATLARLVESAGLRVLEVETIISEIDRILAFPPERVAREARALAGVEPPSGFDAEWLHAHRLGYKVLGLFGGAAP